MSDVAISVLVAARPDAPAPTDLLASVLAQQGPAIEVLVPQPHLAAAAGDPRVRGVAVGAQAGVATVCNALMGMARGDLVAVADPLQPWATTDKLARQAAAMARHGDAVASFCALPGAPGPVPAGRTQWLRALLMRGQVLADGSAVARRREVQAAGGWDTRFELRAHLDLWLRLLGRGELQVVTRPLVRLAAAATGDSARHGTQARNEEAFLLEQALPTLDGGWLRAAFGDLLVRPDDPRPQALAVERALLAFQAESDAQAACWMLGLRLMHDLLADPSMRPVLADYRIDDRWFHDRMAQFSAFFQISEADLAAMQGAR